MHYIVQCSAPERQNLPFKHWVVIYKKDYCAPSVSSTRAAAPFWLKYPSAQVVAGCRDLHHSALFSGTDAHTQSWKKRVKLCLLPIPLLHPGCYIHCCREIHDGVTLPLWPHHLHQSHPSFTSAKQERRCRLLRPCLYLLGSCTSVYIVLEKTMHSTLRARMCLPLVLQTGLCNCQSQGPNNEMMQNMKNIWHVKLRCVML